MVKGIGYETASSGLAFAGAIKNEEIIGSDEAVRDLCDLPHLVRARRALAIFPFPQRTSRTIQHLGQLSVRDGTGLDVLCKCHGAHSSPIWGTLSSGIAPTWGKFCRNAYATMPRYGE